MGNVKVKVLRTCNLSDFSADTQVHYNILLQKICMFQLQTWTSGITFLRVSYFFKEDIKFS